METDPVIIRITAIDETTPVITAFTEKLMKLQSFKIPELKLPEVKIPDLKNIDMSGLNNVKYEIVNTIKPLKDMQDSFLGFRRLLESKGLFGKTKTEMKGVQDVSENLLPIWRADIKVFDQLNKFTSENVFAFNNLETALKTAGISQKQWGKYARDNFLAEKVGIGITNTLTGQTVSYGRAVQEASLRLRRFKFEWLSIMFAGMALDRVFGGLIRSQFDLWGVSDLLGAAWTIVLLPVMEQIIPIIYKLIELFMGLPEPFKIAIGWMVLIGAAIGILAKIIGSFMLALGGIKLLFPGLFAGIVKIFTGIGTAIKGAIAGIGHAISAIAPFIVPIIAIVIGVIDIFENWGKSVKGVVGGILIALAGIVGIIAVILGAPALIVAGIVAAVVVIIKVIVHYWETIKTWFLNFWDWISNLFSKIWDGIKVGLSGLANTFKVVFEAIKSMWITLTGFFTVLWNGIRDIIRAFISWVGSVFSALWVSVTRGFQAAGKAFANVWEGIKSSFKSAMNFIISIMNSGIGGIEKMINLAIKGINALIKLANKIPGVHIGTLGSVSLGRIPYFEKGGIMPYTGLAMLHEGERVIPKNQVNNSSQTIVVSPTFNISAEVNSSYDVRKLAGELNSYWASDFRRVVQNRGI